MAKGKKIWLDVFSVEDAAIGELCIPERYGNGETFLHGSCLYEGAYEPISTERRIREMINYIKNAKRIAYGRV